MSFAIRMVRAPRVLRGPFLATRQRFFVAPPRERLLDDRRPADDFRDPPAAFLAPPRDDDLRDPAAFREPAADLRAP
ncbi:MAG: hypothetical protein ACRD1U_14190, partial [Vicinamibacterales bacterium]